MMVVSIAKHRELSQTTKRRCNLCYILRRRDLQQRPQVFVAFAAAYEEEIPMAAHRRSFAAANKKESRREGVHKIQ